jgi:hypothetical protein
MSNSSKPENFNKWRISIISGLIVLLIFNSYTFKATNSIFGNILTNSNCPTLLGYLVHTIVYIIFIRLYMGH